MDLFSPQKGLILPAIIPFILSAFNCHIYMKYDSLIFGLIPLLWRITITALVFYVLAFWPLMTTYYKTYARRKNRLLWGIYAFTYCYGITLLTHIIMMAVFWGIFVAILIGGAAVGIMHIIIR